MMSEILYTNTTPVWRVETMLPVMLKVSTSAFSALILMRMLGVMTRVMREAVYGGGVRRTKPPVSEILIYIYPRVRFHKDTLSSPRCVICLCEGNNNAILECGHAFHWACVCPWLNAHNTCPLCMRRQSRRGVDAMGRLVAGVE